MPRRLLANFHPRQQPWITRQSYSHELVTSLTFPIAMAMVEGGVIAVLAAKVFHVSELAFATILASPALANLTSVVWTRLSQGKRKVRFFNGLQIALLVGLLCIATLPTTGAGPQLLVLLIIIIRCLASGLPILRTSVWRMNYPTAVRAQITGKLIVIATATLTFSPLVIYAILDWDQRAFRIMYPAAALVAMIGVIAFSRVRLRGERALLRFEKESAKKNSADNSSGNINSEDPPKGFLGVLKQDRLFRQYMTWQFLLGMANLGCEAAVIRYVATETQGKPLEFVGSIILTTSIPWALATVTLPFWARYLDRVHITEFRAKHTTLWILAIGSTWLVTASGIFWLLIIPRVLQGIGRGGGLLAWNLGHNDFADSRMVRLYMGVHVTLTGVRGLIAPYLAILLMGGLSPVTLFGWTSPGFEGIGVHVFGISTVLVIIACIGFVRLHLSVKRERSARVA